MKAIDRHDTDIRTDRKRHSAALAWGVVMIMATLLALPHKASAKAARAGNALYDRWSVFTDQQLISRGMDFLARQEADSALVCYTIVTERLAPDGAKGKDADRLIAAMYNMGYIYSTFYSDYPKAFSCWQQALRLSEQSGQTKSLPYIYNSMAGMYQLNDEMHGQDGTLEEVMQLFAKGFATAVGNRDWDVAFVIFNNMVADAVKHRRTDLIAPQLKLMRSTSIPKQTPMLDYIRLTCSGAEAFRRGRYAQAAQCFALADRQTGGDWEFSAYYHPLAVFNQARSLMQAGRHAEATGLLCQVEREAMAAKDREVLAEVRQMLRDCYKETGNPAEAERYYVAYLKDRDSLLTTSRLEVAGRMRFLDEIDKMTLQVRQLSVGRRLQTVVLCGVAAVALVVMDFLVLLARKNRALSYRNRMLYRNNVAALQADAQQRSMIQNYERQIAALKQTDNEKPQTDDKAEREKYKGSTLGSNEKQQLAARIRQIMDNETEEICSENFSLARLAELAGSNSRYVSQVVNEHFGCNFNSLLSDYRIREACRRLNDHAHYGSLTIEGISRSVGFKSRSNFAAVFRRQTGLSPSEYQRMTRETGRQD